MGKWQNEIYRSALAQLIKNEYRILLAIKTDEDAESSIIEYCMRGIIPGRTEESQIWLSLALREWEYGRLSSDVKERALFWIESSENGICPETLDKLRTTLESPMPPKKHVKLPSWVKHCPWEVGSLLAYRVISSSHERIKNSPLWGNYVLLRIIMIRRNPVTLIAPDDAWNESMLVGLYKWWGTEIPDPSIVKSLEFIPIQVMRPSISEKILERTVQSQFANANPEVYSKLIDSVTKPRIETCCCLDWNCAKGIRRDEVFTYLGCDSEFQNSTSDFFKIGLTECPFCNSIAFDADLVNRFQQLNAL